MCAADAVADTNAPIKTIISPYGEIISQKCDYHLSRPIKYMFRNLNEVHMCSESEDIAKKIFSAPFGGHLGFRQIRWSPTHLIQLDVVYII